MADLLALSSRIIDEGILDEPANRITQELSEVADGIAVIESFSHVVALRTDEGLVVFDTSGVWSGGEVVASLRRWSEDPVHSDTVAPPARAGSNRIASSESPSNARVIVRIQGASGG